MLKTVCSIALLPCTLLSISGLALSASAQSSDAPELAPPSREILYQRNLAPNPNQNPNSFDRSTSPSTPLNFEAAIQSIRRLQSLPSGFISYQGLPNASVSTSRCWMIDSQRRRIDLSVLCSGR